MYRVMVLLTLVVLSVISAPADSPIEPFDMQKILGRGFDVSWTEFNKNIENYSDKQVKWMKARGFSTARIRFDELSSKNLFTDTTAFFRHVDSLIYDCFDNGIIPILAYNAKAYELAPTDSNMSIDSAWWGAVAAHYKDYSHKLIFDLNIEWSDIGGKDADGVNRWYKAVTNAIRPTNPDRIIMYSPIKLSNPKYLPLMEIPDNAGEYVMAEFHSYAAGPNPDSLSANGKPNPKYWTTGTEYQKSLVREMISSGRNWQDSTHIATWLGAWMAGNNNHGNTFTTEQQVSFASYFVKVLDSLSIPWAINTLDMYYDIEADTEFVEVQFDSITINVGEVLDVLTPKDSSTALQNRIQKSEVNPVSITQINKGVEIAGLKDIDGISIYTINGRKLMSLSIDGKEKVTLPTSSLSMGSYIVELNGKSSIVKRIVIK